MSAGYAGFRAKQIHAFFVIEADDQEGLPAFKRGNTVIPLVGTDGARVHDLRNMAADFAKATGMCVEHVVFETRRHVEWIEP